MNKEDELGIKIGDMIKSDTGRCCIVVENNKNGYILNWSGDPKEWRVETNSVKTLIKFGKWQIVTT